MNDNTQDTTQRPKLIPYRMFEGMLDAEERRLIESRKVGRRARRPRPAARGAGQPTVNPDRSQSWQAERAARARVQEDMLNAVLETWAPTAGPRNPSAIAYVRSATMDARPAVRQLQMINEFARREGLRLTGVVVGYTNGLSLCPSWKRTCEASSVAVICSDVSRLARNADAVREAIELAEGAGKRIGVDERGLGLAAAVQQA